MERSTTDASEFSSWKAEIVPQPPRLWASAFLCRDSRLETRFSIVNLEAQFLLMFDRHPFGQHREHPAFFFRNVMFNPCLEFRERSIKRIAVRIHCPE